MSEARWEDPDEQPAMAGYDTPEQDVRTDLDEAVESLDLIKIYLNRIGKIAVLTAEQEAHISRRIEAGLMAGRVLAARRLELADDNDDDKAVRTVAEKLFTRAKSESDEDEAHAERALERRLGAIERDGEIAKKEMIDANLRLVVSVAKKYRHRGMSFLDVIQEGNLGLMHAVEKFDYTKGYKFSTYATWWIRQTISRSLADQSRAVRIPVHRVEKMNKVGRINRQLTQSLGREPTAEEIAAEYGGDMDAALVTELRQDDRSVISLDRAIGEDQEDTLGGMIYDDTTEPSQYVIHREMPSLLARIMAQGRLTEQEMTILRQRNGVGVPSGMPMTLDAIGEEQGLSRERIRQIERDAMRKLTTLRTNGVLGRYFTDD